jgi:hypothetical protein
MPIERVSAAARLDRLPITSFHRKMMWLLGFVFFFELADLNTFAFAAPAIRSQWHNPIRNRQDFGQMLAGSEQESPNR